MLYGVLDQGQLGRDRVDGVCDVVDFVWNLFKQSFKVIGENEGLKRKDLRLWIDVLDSRFHDLSLVHAHSTVIGNALTVDIGYGDRVVVNQNEAADAASGQGFNTVGAHSADAEDGDAGTCQRCHGVLTQQELTP